MGGLKRHSPFVGVGAEQRSQIFLKVPSSPERLVFSLSPFHLSVTLKCLEFWLPDSLRFSDSSSSSPSSLAVSIIPGAWLEAQALNLKNDFLSWVCTKESFAFSMLRFFSMLSYNSRTLRNCQRFTLGYIVKSSSVQVQCSWDQHSPREPEWTTVEKEWSDGNMQLTTDYSALENIPDRGDVLVCCLILHSWPW